MGRQKIASTELAAFRIVFGSFGEYADRYKQIQNILGSIPQAKLFAFPQFLPTKNLVNWFTEHNANQIQSFTKLSDTEQGLVLNQLSADIKKIQRKISEYSIKEDNKSIEEEFEKWLEIPSEEFIYAARDAQGHLIPILTMWGCLQDKIGSPKGILKKIIPQKVANINIKLSFPNEERKLNGIKVKVSKDGGEFQEMETSPKGVASFGKALEGTSFITKVEEFKITQQFTCDGRMLYELPIVATVVLRVCTKSHKGEPIPNIPLAYRIGEEAEQQTTTDGVGECLLDQNLLGESIHLKYYFNGKWSEEQAFKIKKSTKEIVLSIDNKKTIKVLNAKKEPIKNLPLSLQISKEQYEFKTDEQGQFQTDILPNEGTVILQTTYEKRDYKKNIKLQANQSEYEVILKPNRWLLLLWLLPLLLLFIPFQDNLKMDVHAAFNDLAIEKAHVGLDYGLQADELITKDTLTDIEGLAVFDMGKASIFKRLFWAYPQGQVYVHKHCYIDTTLDLTNLSRWKKTMVNLQPSTIANIDFVVKNQETEHPISDATVDFRVEYQGILVKEGSVLTNFGGTVSLQNIPECADVFLRASKQYHSSDSLGQVALDSIARKLEDRTLYLVSELDAETFFIKNTENKKGLPGALIEAHIELNNQVVDTIRTVAAPDGKVTLLIPDEGNLFMRGTLLGYHDSTYYENIADIKNNSDEDTRTLWMRPKNMQQTFTLVDTTTNLPIVNAQVTLNCDSIATSAGNTDLKGETYLGGIRVDCAINIAVNHPDYIPKTISGNYAHFESDANNRIIYLRPKPPAGAAPLDCESDGRQSQRKPTDEAIYFLGKKKGIFKFEYDTDSFPDKIEIYCQDKLIWDYDGATNGKENTFIEFEDSYIKVIVTGSTAWDYTVICP